MCVCSSSSSTDCTNTYFEKKIRTLSYSINAIQNKCMSYLSLLDRASLSYLKNKNQLDTTYYFIILLIVSTCFGHYYAHHQEFATIMLITPSVVSFCSLHPGHYSSLTAPNLQPTANQE